MLFGLQAKHKAAAKLRADLMGLETQAKQAEEEAIPKAVKFNQAYIKVSFEMLC